MKPNLVCVAGMAAVLIIASGLGHAASPSAAAKNGRESNAADWRTVDIVQTNLTPRFVTNLIEVRAPHNVFVTEYRTNRFQRTLTNVVELALTNWSMKTLTNTVAVNLFRTNVVHVYQTNWTTMTITNRPTLTLTNWQTVVVAKTNWIHQPMTNVIAVDAPFRTAVLMTEPVKKPEPKTELAPTQVKGDALVLETTRSTRPYNDNGVEIIFKVRLSSDAAAPLEIPQWRVEREDGAVFFAAQGQEFSRRVPPGRYTVEVKARRDARSPFLATQSVLDVTRDGVARR